MTIYAGRNLEQLHIVINPFFLLQRYSNQHVAARPARLNAMPRAVFGSGLLSGPDQDIKATQNRRRRASETVDVVVLQCLFDALTTLMQTEKSLCAIIIETGLSYDYTFPSAYRNAILAFYLWRLCLGTDEAVAPFAGMAGNPAI